MVMIQEQVKRRFEDLSKQAQQIPLQGNQEIGRYAAPQAFYAWASSALSVIQGVFGKDSPYYVRLETETAGIHGNYVSEDQLGACRGIFQGAKSDVDGGYLFDLQTSFSGEIFGDFVSAAKTALGEGHHTVATVLACAALEDALKRFATSKGLSVENKSMEDVVNALKAQGLVTGSQKTLLAAMPKIRNQAMHADWSKLTSQDAGSVISFVEQFLLNHFV
ncbi:MAG TPA: DUF4145 domain-containing protein [Thermodesulfobacteriota bacterium]|nr:DUF4145 domain-containing protein [Thermodesulfobacteriota bacterium]